MHPPIRSSFESGDPDAAATALAAGSRAVRLRTVDKDAGFHCAHRRLDLGGVRLDTVTLPAATEFVVDPLPEFRVVRVARGSVALDRPGDRRRFHTGDVLLAAHPGQTFRAHAQGEIESVSIAAAVLDAAGVTPGDRLFDAPRTDPLPSTLASFWRHTVRYLDDAVAGNPHAASSPAVLAGVGRLIGATFVSIFAADESVRPAAHNGVERAPRTVRLAVAYIETNPDLDIGVADIARAAHVGVRALQLAFRQHLDTTPLSLLRRVRLARAHADLLASDDDSDTVTRIAARWGFTDPSRFTANYRAEYGTTPSRTLRA